MVKQATLFETFGGIRPMAEALGESPSSIQGWKNTGRVPATKQPLVLMRAAELGLDVTTDDVVFPLGRPAVACDRAAETKEPHA